MIIYEEFKRETIKQLRNNEGLTLYESGASIVVFMRSYSHFTFDLQQLYTSYESDYKKCVAHVLSVLNEEFMLFNDHNRFSWIMVNMWSNLKLKDKYYTLQFYDMIAILQYRVNKDKVVSVKRDQLIDADAIRLAALRNSFSSCKCDSVLDTLGCNNGLFQYLEHVYYVTNDSHLCGASQIINYTLLDRLRGRYSSDLIILPVCIHGLIVFPEELFYYDLDDYYSILHRMNLNVNEHRFILSYSIYKYCGNRKLKIYKRGI